ncbi:hypothetical protein EDC04DRAFT_2634081 [Pisolithus marmoratus]|nr:hypothetical protein EDC04DRAFT_2634081 [Pisolithus marmoratus]
MNPRVAGFVSKHHLLEDHDTVLRFNCCFSTDTLRNSSSLLVPDSQRSSCSSTKPSPTVRFAPLPKIDSTRKRSIPPLGVSARARHICIAREGQTPLWSIDPSSEEIGEDPIIVLGRFFKEAGMRMLQKVRKKYASHEKDDHRAINVIDIKPDEASGDTEPVV